MEMAEPGGAMRVCMLSVPLEQLMTPPGSPRTTSMSSAVKKPASKRRTVGRQSLSDWWGANDAMGSDSGGSDSECKPGCIRMDLSDDDGNFSTTASEAGEKAAPRPRSPKRRSHRRVICPSEPLVFHMGDDTDDAASSRLSVGSTTQSFMFLEDDMQALMEKWNATRRRSDASVGSELDVLEVDLCEQARGSLPPRSSQGSLSRRASKKHDTLRWWGEASSCSTSEPRNINMDDGEEADGAEDELSASQCVEPSGEGTTNSESKTSKSNVNSEAQKMIVEVLRRKAMGMSPTHNRLFLPKEFGKSKYTSFESGVGDHLNDLLKRPGDKINVMLIAYEGKKRVAAPPPDEFAESMQGLISKHKDTKELDKKAVKEAAEQYTKIFEDVMGLSKKQYSSQTFDGGLDAVVELLDDVRTGAWNMAAFLWRS